MLFPPLSALLLSRCQEVSSLCPDFASVYQIILKGVVELVEMVAAGTTSFAPVFKGVVEVVAAGTFSLALMLDMLLEVEGVSN